VPTGNTFHTYLNPECPVAEGAFRVHGLSNEFLSDKPKFADIGDAFLDFCADSRLVIHNAPFDIGFLNAELSRVGRPTFELKDAVDTLILARRKHPGASNSLDALCSRYSIDNSRRTKHGALLDSEILVEVYLELIGGKQTALSLVADSSDKRLNDGESTLTDASLTKRIRTIPLAERLSENDMDTHRQFMKALGEKAIWKTYISE
jgi:DNA polymerase-3 subunit epsilon